MRTVIAQIYDYSLDGISAEEDSSFFDFCRALPDDPVCLERAVDFYRKADLLVMGRTHYQGASAYLPSAGDDPYADVMNAARKVVFSHTLATADWANTTVINGDLAAEIEKLKLGGDGYIIADGGLRLLQSLIRHDLVDEFRISLVGGFDRSLQRFSVSGGCCGEGGAPGGAGRGSGAFFQGWGPVGAGRGQGGRGGGGGQDSGVRVVPGGGRG